MLANATLQVLVCTTRPEEASKFYAEQLGLPRLRESHGAQVFGVGAQEIRLSPVPAHTPSEHTILGFAVEDVTETMRALAARGVPSLAIPGLPHDADGVVRTPQGAKVAWIRDPDGNILSVVAFAG